MLRPIGHVRPAIHNDSPKILNVFGGLSLDYFDDDYNHYPTSSIPDNLRRTYQIETSDDDYDRPYSAHNDSSDNI
ncbi:hypothetical protein FJ364_04560 [Candidatus Dependentiae bacterium]|nr:hypothetical protein [Candidatus Dependentiae bacterium]